MSLLLPVILTLSIIAGQLIKIPLFFTRGITLLDLVVICLTLIGIYQIKLKLKKPPLPIKLVLIFTGTGLLSLILSPLKLTVTEVLSSAFYDFRFFLYILLGWLLTSQSLINIKLRINQILLFSGLDLAVLGLLQFIFLPDLRFLSRSLWDPHYYRTVSTFLDPNFLGAYLCLTLILIFSQPMFNKKNIIFFTLVYLALLTTFSRSSYLMFLFTFLTFAFFKKSIKIAFLTIFLFLILLLSFQIQIRLVNRTTPLDRSQTAGYRLSTWQQGFQIFQKNPVLGVGFNAYYFALKQYNLADAQFLSGLGSTFNDSSLLHMLATTGVIGFFIYIGFLKSLINLGWSKNPKLAAAIVGIIPHSIFVNSLFYPFILIWIILVISQSYDKNNQ